MRSLFELLEERRLMSTVIVGAGQQYTTLQAAANAVKAGDTIVVDAGTYAGFQLIDKVSGTAAAPIVFDFKAGAKIASADGSTHDAIDIEGCNYVTIEGATIANHGGGISRAGIRLAECNNAKILDNNISGVGAWGIYTSHSSNTLIEGNTSDDNAAHGIYVANSETGVQILDNSLFGNANCGIHINGDASQGDSGLMTNFVVEDNIIYGNGKTGGSAINCDGLQNSVIEKNLLYGNLHTGIALFDGDSSAGPMGDTVANNTIVMPGKMAIEVEKPKGANFIFNDILIGSTSFSSGTNTAGNLIAAAVPANVFAAGGYKLGKSSPAIGMGVATLDGHAAPTTDMLGISSGSKFDAGAY